VFLVISLASAGWVNPLYHGVLDLRSTQTVKAIEQIEEESGGRWVGINSSMLPTMMLVESGVPSLNGFQSDPSPSMWAAIDPDGSEKAVWDRLANVSWVAGEGAPAPRNPAPDQIQMTFDSCNEFAQENVRWVLAQDPLDQDCLQLEKTIPEGPTTMRIYEVVPAG
jgi:hypothetical protein